MSRVLTKIASDHSRRQWRPRPEASAVSVSSDDLPCQELVELVTDYLEARLPEPEQARFEAHLALCSGCRTYLEQMRQTIRVLGRLAEESLQPEAKTQLLAAFRGWRRGARSSD